MKKKMKKRTKESVKDPKCLVKMGGKRRGGRGCWQKKWVYTFDKKSLRCKKIELCYFYPQNNFYETRQECQRTCLKPSDPIFENNTKIYIDNKNQTYVPYY